MFLKQYNYKPRSNSQSSGSDSTSAVSPTTSQTEVSQQQQQPASPVTQSRRRSSATERFAGLQHYKRNSQDQDRKANWADQSTAGSGILGGMWQSFTKGS